MNNEIYRLLAFKNTESNLEVLEWLDKKSNISDFILELLKDKMLYEKYTNMEKDKRIKSEQLKKIFEDDSFWD